MIGSNLYNSAPVPTLVPLGDSALLVRFGTALSNPANSAAIALASALHRDPPAGVLEIMPNLVSVLLRYDPDVTRAVALAGELRLRMAAVDGAAIAGKHWAIPVLFDGPDLAEVAETLGMSEAAFIAAHNQASLRVLSTGFAPGFVYCGLHAPELVLPRRAALRQSITAGSVLFAAGQTAIISTDMPTGWHVIGHTEFRNFDANATPPTRLRAGDLVQFETAP
ncbi:MAG: allophanate hydrolase subunit 1 [Devosia sp.]|nr:allophanate hydrolase subunit 1 [Devosia sp.]